MNTFGKSLTFGRASRYAAAMLLVAAVPKVHAAVILTADPAVPVGAAVETLDPSLFSPAQRGVAGTRQLRQSFQNPADFNVGEIVLSLDLNGTDGGLIIDLYEVEDVNAGNWAPGTLLETISLDLSVDLPATTDRLSLQLTEANVFSLPARNTGTQGYGIEISNFDDSTNIGLITHSNGGVDDFVGGKYYAENGGAPGSGNRDFGVWLLASTVEPPDPGDTDDDGDIDLDDLLPIRQNYLESVDQRLLGDLNGDSVVNSIDFREWKTAFLAQGGALSTADLGFLTAVPEPSTIGLLLAAGLAFIGCRTHLRK